MFAMGEYGLSVPIHTSSRIRVYQYRYLYTQVYQYRYIDNTSLSISVPIHTSSRISVYQYSPTLHGRRILINTIKWTLVLLGMTLTAGHNQICVHQILGVSWNTRLRNINQRHVYGIMRYLQELGCTFNENILPNKGKQLTKKSWRNCVFHAFF